MHHFVSPDAMIAAAAHVEREYGSGYRIGVVASGWLGGGLFQVRASDGSEFELVSDRYGNVTRPDEHAERQAEVPDSRPWTALDGNHDPAPTVPPAHDHADLQEHEHDYIQASRVLIHRHSS
jgi:hypothetical protein